MKIKGSYRARKDGAAQLQWLELAKIKMIKMCLNTWDSVDSFKNRKGLPTSMAQLL